MYVCNNFVYLFAGLGCMIGERTHSRTLIGVEDSTVHISMNVYVCMYACMYVCMHTYVCTVCKDFMFLT